MAKTHFRRELFRFLEELRRNNDRAWFAQNKERYEREVRDPMLAFVADLAAPLAKISRWVLADARPAGGSLFRIYRDVRFSKDKSPYKTHVAAQFRHRAGRDVHAPGFYIHLEPGQVFAAAGLWHPDPAALQNVRTAIARNPTGWKRVVQAPAFRRACALQGGAVARAPRGFDPRHPMIEDIKRKDFVAVARFTEKDALAAGFSARFLRFCRTSSPLNAFLARSLGLGW